MTWEVTAEPQTNETNKTEDPTVYSSPHPFTGQTASSTRCTKVNLDLGVLGRAGTEAPCRPAPATPVHLHILPVHLHTTEPGQLEELAGRTGRFSWRLVARICAKALLLPEAADMPRLVTLGKHLSELRLCPSITLCQLPVLALSPLRLPRTRQEKSRLIFLSSEPKFNHTYKDLLTHRIPSLQIPGIR